MTLAPCHDRRPPRGARPLRVPVGRGARRARRQGRHGQLGARHHRLRRGRRGDCCYVIDRGFVKLTRRLVDGSPITLAQVGQGGIVGELALFASDRRSATMVTLEPTTAVAISREDLLALLSRTTRRPRSAWRSTWRACCNGPTIASSPRPPQRSTGGSSRRCWLRSRRVRRGIPGRRTSSWSVQPDGPRAARRHAPDAATRLLHWLENEGIITLKRGRIIVRSPAALREQLG